MPLRDPVTGAARLIEKDGERYLAIVRQFRGKDVETVYRLTWLDPDTSIGFPAWRLTKADGSRYDVILKPTGPECTCPDFVYCREYRATGACKHCKALRAVGLLGKE